MTRIGRVKGAPVPVMVTPFTGTEDADAVTPSPGDTWIWDGTAWVPGPAGGNAFGALGWYNVEDCGAVHDGTTDDTVAIQDCIDTAAAAGGGTIYFPPGIYQVSGAMQDTSTFNSQLEIPTNSFSGQSVALRFLGAGPQRVYKDEPPGDGETVLRTDWSSTITGHPAMFSAGEWRVTSGNNSQVTFENITIVAPDNPKLSALQMTCASTLFLRNVIIRTDSDAPSGYPTNTKAAGIEGPWAVSFVPEEYSNVAVLGFYTGMYPSEQSYGTVSFAYCKVGMELVALQDSAPYIRWPNQFPKMTFVSCDVGIKASGTGRRWLTGAAAFEHDDSPFTTTYDIDDSGNRLHGFLSIHPTDFTTGPTDILVNNAQRLSYHQPDQDWWRLHSQVHIPTGTDPTADPYSGRTIYADSGTGDLTVRRPDGSTLDLELVATGRWELAVITGSPPDPLYADGDFLYILVP